MINPKELRIGNIVSVNGKFNVYVQEIDCNGVVYDRMDGSEVAAHCQWEYIQPIPLTAELIEKCGFIKEEHGWFNICYSSSYEAAILSVNLFSFRCCIIDEEGVYLKAPMKDLHQLQNLFFAITGEELTVNL